jgi:L-threonylcarbamoyladenylate synthase
MNQKEFTTKEKEAIHHAVELLRAGKLVAIPTETVYGLAANAFDEEAVQAIFKTKGRPSNNPLIVHIKSLHDVEQIARNIPAIAKKLAAQFWPGALTLILDKQPEISDTISAGHETVAVRVPNHPITLELLNRLDFPLVAPSANRSNHISPTKPDHVQHSLGEKTPYILDGGSCEKGLESTIVGFEREEVILYRQGAISQDVLEDFLGKPLKNKAETTAQSQSPGSSKKHYSPKTPLVLVDTLNQQLEAEFSSMAYLVLQKPINFVSEQPIFELSPSGDLEEAAANLFDLLYQLDQQQVDVIVAVRMPDSGLGKSINDRLMRASAK